MQAASRLSSEQIMAMLDEMAAAIEGMRHGVIEVIDERGHTTMRSMPNVATLLDWIRAATRDGYPLRSMGDHSAASVLDDHGDPMPPLSDPTGELAVQDDRVADPIRYSGDTVVRGITGALGDLRMARDALMKLSTRLEPELGEPGCSSHARLGSWESIHKNGRCRWCYDFWIAQGQDPPTDLLDARSAGKRITQRMVDEAMMPKRSGKRRSRRGAA